MKFKANIFSLQYWIYIESTYELSEAALFPSDMNPCSWHWLFKSFKESELISTRQQCFFKITSFSQKTGKVVDFSWASWFRNAAASLHVPIVSLRWVLQLLAGPDLPKQSILYHHTHIPVVCYRREKLLAHMPALITHNNLTHRHIILNCAYSRPKVWGLCWTRCIMSYLHIHSGCLCRNWK